MGFENVDVWRKSLAGGRWGALLLSRVSKFLILLGLVVISGLGNFARIRTEFVRGDFGLDQSWLLSLGDQWHQGHIVGRDIVFTYGPLAQLLVSIAAAWQGSGSVLNAISLSYFLFRGAALIILALCLGLIKPLRWAEALFIFLVIFSLNLMVLRPLLVLLSVILLVRALTSAASHRRGWAVGAGGLCLAGLLFSVDTGFFALASAVGLLLVCLVLTLPWFNRWGISAGLLSRQNYVEILVVFGATFSLGLLGLEIFFQLSSPTYQAFDYLRYSLATLLRYNYAMGIPWMSGTRLGPIFVPSLFLVITYTAGFVLVSAFNSLKTGEGDRAHLLLGILIAAGFTFKAALVRSDVEHLASGVVILVFLFVLSLMFLSAERFPLLGGSLLILFWLMWPGKQSFNSFDANALSVVEILPEVASGRFSPVEKWQQIRSLQVDPHLFVSPELVAAVDAQKIIVNFPSDNVLAIALGQKSLTPVLQTYAAFDESLQRAYVQTLSRSQPDLEVIYGIEPFGAWPIDGVQNVTRVPIIFNYLVENFKLKTTNLFNNYALLEPRAAPQPLSLTPLVYTRESADQGFDLRLSQPARCSLVQLELLIRYPVTAAFGRPTGLLIKAWNGESQILESRLVALETGRRFSTFLYLGRPERFEGLFDDQGRIETRALFDRLSFRRLVFGLFDVYPNQVEVSALRCVQPPPPLLERKLGEVEHLAPGETVHLNWYMSADVPPDAFVRPVYSGIFMHPENQLEFGPFVAPPNTCFTTQLTLDPEVAHHPEADGVEFSFTITFAQQVFTQQTNDLAPTDAALPVAVAVPVEAPFTLRLQTAPRGTFDMDWAIWEEPRLGPCT